VAGNTLAAQHFNYFQYHLTKELNNLLTAVGIGQSASDDTQLTQAVGLNQISISASGTTVASAFKGDTWTKFNNSGGASTYDISAGASRSGVRLTIEETNANGVTIKTGTGMTAFLGVGAIHLLWDGTQWVKIGGSTILAIFTSGSGATWITPWAGTFKVTVIGGGGGSGGCTFVTAPVSAGGGGGGGCAIKMYSEQSNSTFTYTIGTGGTAGNGSPTSGGAGNNTTVTDGTLIITGSGGGGGINGSGTRAGGSGGTGTNGDLNIQGGGGGSGSIYNTGTGSNSISGGVGGSSFFGGGASAVSTSGATNGNAGGQYGGGASGSTMSGGSGSSVGAVGASGVVVIEF
jgi:hypothetical protein